MKILYGLRHIGRLKKPVLAMGVFDGLHRGHMAVLGAAVDKARQLRGYSIVITFWPHPQKEESLYSLEHRLRLFAQIGIDVCIVLNFSKHFSKIMPGDFVKDILIRYLKPAYIYVGNDFKFGRKASGNLDLLKKLGKTHNFKVRGFNILKVKGKPISSTSIRSYIKSGDFRSAQRLLGKPVSILGTVIRGTALGRILGFPTANINPHHEVIPPPAIYAVKIIIKGQIFKGVCYIGIRPTIKSIKHNLTIEVNIFNFSRNIYGENIEIQFIKKIRSDKKFPDIESLAQQIRKDVVCAKKLLTNP